MSKDITEYTAAPATKDRLDPRCKPCKSIFDKKVYHANKEKRARQYALRYRANKSLIIAQHRKACAVKRGAVLPDNFKVEDTISFYEEARRLTEETGILHHVDHIIPCTRGGLHCHTNLQVLTAEANLKKHNSIVGETL
jgi:hypothetical protein